MKGGYAPVPQAYLDESESGTIFKEHRGNKKRYWKVLYGLMLTLLAAGVGIVLWYLTSAAKDKDLLIKPLYDKKNYKAIVLDNGMHCLLIEDKHTLLSGVGLDLQVGSMSDMDAGSVYMGLAHFTEHAMYMGSEEYPRFNELANFLQTHGGNDNAFTTQTHTNYYFYVNSESIEHSMKIFAASFRHPLFKPEVLEGEKQAIQNELEKDIPQKSWKKFSILKLISDPKHAFHRFNVGSKEIFDSADFVSKIKWFYKSFYSANLMNMVLLSNLPLGEQEELVRREFSTIPNRNVTKPTFYSNPYPKGSKFINQYIVYENGALTQDLELLFPIAYSEEDMELDNKLVLTILGDENKGTLTSILRDLGYIIDLSASTLTFPASFSCVTLQIHLTSLGCCKVKEITKIVFEYISLMKSEITEETWRDNFELQQVRFNYHDESNIKTLLKMLPGMMAAAPSPKYYLNTQLKHGRYSKEDIKKILDQLTYDNVNILQGGVGFDKLQCKLPELDKFDDSFKSRYHSSQIQDSWLKLWATDDEPIAHLTLPPKNDFIPKEFSIVPSSTTPQPAITLDEDGFKSYWKQDSSLPKSYVDCKFFLPGYYSESLESVAILRLYLELVSESLDSVSYAASSAEYRYSLAPVTEGFKLQVEGFSDKETFFKFLKLVVLALTDPPPITPLRYKYQVQEMLYDSLNRIYMDQPFRQGFWLARMFYLRHSHENKALNEIILKLTQQQVLEQGRDLLRKMAIKCFTFGNHDEKESLKYSLFVRKHFLSHILRSSYAYLGTVIALPPGRTIWQLPVLNPTETNNCVFIMNEIAQSTTSGPSLRKHVLLTMLATMMKDPAYATLRTEEHLGYTVFTGSMKILSVDFFYLLLQGSHFTPEVMTQKVVGFLLSYRTKLAALIANGTAEHPSGDEWFSVTKREAINHLLSQPEAQIGLSEHYAHISQSEWPFFNRGEYIVAGAHMLIKEDLLAFYDHYIIGDARQLVIQLHGKNYPVQRNTTVPHSRILSSDTRDHILQEISPIKGGLNPVNVEFVW